MALYYRCQSCGWEGNEFEVEVREFTEKHEFWGAPVFETLCEYYCPDCGSEDVEETSPTEEDETIEGEETWEPASPASPPATTP